MTQQTMKPEKRAVIYLRARAIDGSNHNVDAQLELQRAACTRIARKHGAAIVGEYEAIGGVRDSHVRSIVRVMLDRAAQARADYVITYGMDRLCRGPAATDRALLLAIRKSGAVLLCGSTWDVSAPLGPSDDVLAEAHQAMAAERPA